MRFMTDQVPDSSQAPSVDTTADVHDKLLADTQPPNRTLIESAVHTVVGTVWSADSDARKQTESALSEFIKAVPLFIPGGRGIALSAAMFGLGEVRTNDSLGEQAAEFGMGMAKGALTKTAFNYVGGRDWGFAAKGMAMGSSARFLDTAFTPANYYSNGNFDLSAGLNKAAFNAGDATALTIDAITFGAAHFVQGVLPNKIAQNALVGSSLTGASFGFASGVLGELQRQMHNGESLDVGSLVASGGREAAIMSAAAAVGHGFAPKAAASTSETTPSSTTEIGEPIKQRAPRIIEIDEPVNGDPRIDFSKTVEHRSPQVIEIDEPVSGDPRIDFSKNVEHRSPRVIEIDELVNGDPRIDFSKNVEHRSPQVIEIDEPVNGDPRIDFNKPVPQEKTNSAARKETGDGVTINETAATVKAGYVGYFLDPAAAAKIETGLVVNGEKVAMPWKAPSTYHVTEKFGVKSEAGAEWTSAATARGADINVIGLATDSTGVQALHVSVDGRTIREDGRPYHITRSLADGRKAAESMEVVEKALKVGSAKNNALPDGIIAEDLTRYKYETLRPDEQFKIIAEPRFRETEITAPKVKEGTSKPEIPFEELSSKMQVITALNSTPAEYLQNTISTRTAESHIGSYFDMTGEQLKSALYRAQWEPYDPIDANGNHIIGGGARGYRATIAGGRLGMTAIENIPESSPLYLVDPKGTGKWSLSTVGVKEPQTETVTMIVGPDTSSNKPVMWTFHPGEPVRPSMLDSATLQNALSSAGVDTSSLPTTGADRRVAINRAQLDHLNAVLPQEGRMDLAKIENANNTSR